MMENKEMIEYTFKAEKEITCCGRCPLALVDEKLKDNELICNVKLRTEDIASKGYILSADGKYWFLHNRHKDCPLKEVSNHADWHTGRPTEEGWYFCLVDTGTETKFMANEWKDIAGYQWVYGFLGEIIAWRKAEDPIKILNEAKSDFVK